MNERCLFFVERRSVLCVKRLVQRTQAIITSFILLTSLLVKHDVVKRITYFIIVAGEKGVINL